MPVFAYRGVIAGNRTARGMVDADSLRAARAKLRSEGIFPTQLSEGRVRSPASELLSQLKLPQLRRVPDLDLALFSSQLATLLSAGQPLVESLGALTEQIENARLKAIVGQIREAVREGATLADAMGQHPHVFEELYCSMVRAGESAGALTIVLQRLADYVEGRMALRNKVINAMIYPVLMFVLSLGVMGVLLVVVVPTIKTLLLDAGRELPLITRIVIGISDFATAWWLPLGIGVVAAPLAFSRAIRSERGRFAWDRLRLRIPLLGRWARHIAISRLSRTLSTLLAGGVSIVSALEISREVAGNAVIARAVDEAKDAITSGASIAGPLRQSGQFPPMVTHMIAVGEASGELHGMLEKVSDTYDQMVANGLERLMAVMGPVLLIFVSGLVVLVMLATLLPLMDLTATLPV